MSKINRSSICRMCKNEYTLSSDASIMYCPECLKATNEKRRKTNAKKSDDWRPLTPDTEMLVCLWHNRGDTPKRIASDLRRPVEQINSILHNAKQSGRYEKHIERHNEYVRSGIPQYCSIKTFEYK